MPPQHPAPLAATPQFAAGGRSARRLPPARRPRPAPLENHAGSTARSRQPRLPEQSAPSLATRRAAGPGRARGRDPLGLGLLRFRLDPSRTLAGGHRAAPLGCPAQPPGLPCTWFFGGIDSARHFARSSSRGLADGLYTRTILRRLSPPSRRRTQA